jgi:formamidopyrimidine-DNA glycosylase
MTHAQCAALVSSIREVLTDAIRWGGTTLRDYRGVDQEAGYFGQELRVYGLEAEPCHCCETPIRRVVEGGRSTYYCPTCQS